MATPYVARRLANAKTEATLAERLLVAIIWNRVRISQLLLTGLILFDLLIARTPPHNLFNWRSGYVLAGLALILAGLAIRSWAAGTLRKCKSLITTGPYAFVRNPLYLGSFLMMAGFCLLMNDWNATWVVIGPVVGMYWLAIWDEEQLMQDLFPDAWPSYAATVPRILPRRLIVPKGEGWSLKQWLHNREYNAWVGVAVGLAGLYLWWLAIAS
jgi:protein-S-isoprenylcysteine O-methyltransferase Ste14